MPVSFDSIDMPPKSMLSHVDASSELCDFLENDKYTTLINQNEIIC